LPRADHHAILGARADACSAADAFCEIDVGMNQPSLMASERSRWMRSNRIISSHHLVASSPQQKNDDPKAQHHQRGEQHADDDWRVGFRHLSNALKSSGERQPPRSIP